MQSPQLSNKVSPSDSNPSLPVQEQNTSASTTTTTTTSNKASTSIAPSNVSCCSYRACAFSSLQAQAAVGLEVCSAEGCPCKAHMVCQMSYRAINGIVECKAPQRRCQACEAVHLKSHESNSVSAPIEDARTETKEMNVSPRVSTQNSSSDSECDVTPRTLGPSMEEVAFAHAFWSKCRKCTCCGSDGALYSSTIHDEDMKESSCNYIVIV